MDKIKEFLRNNKKLLALVLVALLGLAGVKLAPETADKIVDTVVQTVAPEPATVPAPVVTNPAPTP